MRNILATIMAGLATAAAVIIIWKVTDDLVFLVASCLSVTGVIGLILLKRIEKKIRMKMTEKTGGTSRQTSDTKTERK